MQSNANDNGPRPDVEALTPLEQRLQTALKQEAAHWQEREPSRLSAACRAPRPGATRATDRFRAWRWAGVAAALLLAVILTGRPHVRHPPLFKPVPTQVMAANAAERAALHALLPKFPPLPRPPAPVRLRPDRVIVLNP